MALYLGIDIGGTKIAGGLVTSEGQILRRAEQPTPREGGRAILDTALSVARSLAAGDTLAGAGIGTGGQVDAERGVIVSATDILPGWAGTDVKGAFEEAFHIPAAVENDVNALAVGEARFGTARGLPTVVFLALGTGVGGALLLNGRAHHGAHWVGGEFGHILLSVDSHARRAADGSVGSLEAYCSGPGLAQTWREIAASDDLSVTGHRIAGWAAREPNGPAAQAVRRTGEYLGYGLVTLANALDPDRIVIGGGLAS
ncbi:MAG TPA: ROK family protein, partial [Capsulimonadaceae bacterium]|nr:ROK family protein [Capsulimonadaceae bacterium]